MVDPEYMWVPLVYLPDEVTDAYDLHEKVHKGRVLVRIVLNMYGFLQAGRLAFDQLK